MNVNICIILNNPSFLYLDINLDLWWHHMSAGQAPIYIFFHLIYSQHNTYTKTFSGHQILNTKLSHPVFPIVLLSLQSVLLLFVFYAPFSQYLFQSTSAFMFIHTSQIFRCLKIISYLRPIEIILHFTMKIISKIIYFVQIQFFL